MRGSTYIKENPFGFLEPIHQHILHNATPLTVTNWPMLFIVPLIPLSLVCYLVQIEGTRRYRLPLGILGCAMIVRAAMSYRFDEIEYNAFNNGICISAMHLAAKYLEYGCIKGPIVDPYVARGSRSLFMGAIDLAINSRMVGLGRIKSSRRSPVGRTSNEVKGPDGGVQVNGSATPDVIPHHRERWLPYTSDPGRSRLSAAFRHFRLMVIYYTVFDTLMALLWHVGGSTIADPHGRPGAVQTFLDSSHFVMLPKLAHPLPVPTALVVVIIELSIATAVWQAISMGYHTVALMAVASGLWETEAWEVDIFDAPWKADSILDMWGRRWHQIFRHHFLLVSVLVLRTLRLPTTPTFVLPIIFFLSGAMHALGQISMSLVPDPIRIAMFFVLSGVGAALEAMFSRLTGKHVRGLWGRIWMWTWFIVTGRFAAFTWLEGGLGGNRLVPTDFAFRPGRVITRWLIEYAFDTVKR